MSTITTTTYSPQQNSISNNHMAFEGPNPDISLKELPLAQIDPEDVQNSQIVNFYKGKNILITGGTGFLGKVILWKLIDTCQNYNKIYLLLRSKNDVSAQKRLVQLLKAKPFSYKYDYAQLLNRIVAIESDMTADNLGLNQSDRQLLVDEVNVVIHSAASVKFDAPLKDNLRDNVTGTRSILSLCKELRQLKALVHVSTAYSNCHERNIAEAIIPLQQDIDQVCKLVENLPKNISQDQTMKLLEGRPNTYTYTKALAEHFVAREQDQLPISIVRPSIVISAAEEPCPGWVDNVNGIAGLSCLAAIGILRTIDWNYYGTSDMVPVDYVANSILCAAFKANENFSKRENSVDEAKRNMQIFNMTSGNQKPISWGKFFKYGHEHAVEMPSNKIVRPTITSPKYRRANKVTFMLTKFFSEILFAYFVDTLLNLLGYKKIMVRITQKMHNGYTILKPFTTNEWNFQSDKLLQLSDSLSPSDKRLFKFDMRNFDWKKQARDTWLGSRHFLLKEELSEDSYRKARIRQRTVTIIHNIGAGLLIAAFVSIVYSGLRILTSSLTV